MEMNHSYEQYFLCIFAFVTSREFCPMVNLIFFAVSQVSRIAFQMTKRLAPDAASTEDKNEQLIQLLQNQTHIITATIRVHTAVLP